MQTLALDAHYERPSIMLADRVTVDSPVWWLVLIAILLALGVTLILGAIAWCIAHGHGEFEGLGSKSGWFKIWVKCTN
jgi:hypothetical protein